MKSQSPIFIVGTERSGSNLLRLVLNSHSRIAVPHPPHIMRYFAPIEAAYGDLADVRMFGTLVRDILRLVRNHIYPWDVEFDEHQIARTAPSRSVFGVKAALYEGYRAARGKARWGCKSTFMIDHVGVARAHYPDARLLFLVRDVRDVAASSKRSVFSTYHPYFTACLWREQQTTGLELLSSLPCGSMKLVRYEDLLNEPESTIRELCRFIDEPFEPEMLRYFETIEARRSSSLSRCWRNTGAPILRENTGKYRQELSAEELLLVESIACGPMRALGYSPEHAEDSMARVSVGPAQRLGYWRKEQGARFHAELRSLRYDENVFRRWKRDAIAHYVRLRRGPSVAVQRWLLG